MKAVNSVLNNSQSCQIKKGRLISSAKEVCLDKKERVFWAQFNEDILEIQNIIKLFNYLILAFSMELFL